MKRLVVVNDACPTLSGYTPEGGVLTHSMKTVVAHMKWLQEKIAGTRWVKQADLSYEFGGWGAH